MISVLVSKFAASESGPAIHVAPAHTSFEIAGLTITNSMLYGWISITIMIVLLTWVARRITIKPGSNIVVQIIEMGAEFISNLVTNSFDDPNKGRKYVPFFVTIFFFILLNNWLGLLPGVGPLESNGEPLFRPFTADLNGTLAIGIITMAFVYWSSIRESGGFIKYLRHFFVGNPLNPLYLVIGLLEMLTDLTRTLSLALRLFLNVTIGEIVIAVFTYLGGYLGPVAALPFVLIELFVGALQAYIFTVLSLMYLAIAVNHAGEHAAEHDETEALTRDATPETMRVSPGRA